MIAANRSKSFYLNKITDKAIYIYIYINIKLYYV